MPKGRPQAADPKVQRNIYPPTSLWSRIEKLADKDRRPVAQYVVILLEDATKNAERRT
jgi:hypothetical protein